MDLNSFLESDCSEGAQRTLETSLQIELPFCKNVTISNREPGGLSWVHKTIALSTSATDNDVNHLYSAIVS